MHFVFASRGPIDRTELFIKQLSSQHLPWKRYNPKTKKLEDLRLQMRVCPLQLWDLSYPREHRDAVLNTILQGGEGKPIRDKKTWRMKLLDRVISYLQKLIGLKPLGKYESGVGKPYVAIMPPQDTEIIAIGEKEDYWITEDNKHVDYENKTKLSYEGI